MILTLEEAKALLAALVAGDNETASKIVTDAIAAKVSEGGPEGAEAPPEAALDPLAQTVEPPPADPAKPDEKKDPVVAAALSKLVELTHCTNLGEAVVELTRLQSEREANTVLEVEERKGLVAKLVKLNAETPATAWEGDPAALKPVKFLAEMPIVELRKRVTAFAMRPGAPKIEPPEKKPAAAPPVAGGSTVELSKEIKAQLKAKGMTEEEFIAQRDSATYRST